MSGVTPAELGAHAFLRGMTGHQLATLARACWRSCAWRWCCGAPGRPCSLLPTGAAWRPGTTNGGPPGRNGAVTAEPFAGRSGWR